jgi:glycosyltransferase involved in cell wall biosynthesis
VNSPSSSISVVIPCHNYARFLPDALASVGAQTMPIAQVILVDDGSDDDSAHVAQACRPTATIIRQARQGASAARNTGIAAASGTYIAFLDADDLWPADSIALRFAALTADRTMDGVFGQVVHFLCSDADADVRARLFCPPGANAVRFAGTMLAHRSVFDRVGLFDTSLRVGEMIDWISRAETAGLAVGAVEAPVLHRRIHGSNSVLGTPQGRSDYLRALQGGLRRRRAL